MNAPRPPGKMPSIATGTGNGAGHMGKDVAPHPTPPFCFPAGWWPFGKAPGTVPGTLETTITDSSDTGSDRSADR